MSDNENETVSSLLVSRKAQQQPRYIIDSDESDHASQREKGLPSSSSSSSSSSVNARSSSVNARSSSVNARSSTVKRSPSLLVSQQQPRYIIDSDESDHASQREKGLPSSSLSSSSSSSSSVNASKIFKASASGTSRHLHFNSDDCDNVRVSSAQEKISLARLKKPQIASEGAAGCDDGDDVTKVAAKRGRNEILVGVDDVSYVLIILLINLSCSNITLE